MTVEVRVLGPLEVRIDGRPVPLPGRRPATLLAMLALAGGRTVSIDELARGVWGDDLPERVKGSLQTYVGRLRRILGAQAIATAQAGYRLDTSHVRTDLDRFTALVDRAGADHGDGAALLDEALGLWRGEPLAGLSDWVERTDRSALIERYLATVECRVDLRLAAGDHGGVIVEVRPLVDQHPLREPLWQRLIVALRDAGRPAEALEAYESMRSTLADELGVDPSPALQSLHRELLAEPSLPSARPGGQDRHARAVVPHQLPWVAGRFVGREAELARLDLLAGTTGTVDGADGSGRVIGIHGTGGSGKTTLAVRWAHRSAAAFPDGELFVRLNGYGPGEPVPAAAALETMLRGLGVDGSDVPGDLDGRSSLLRTHLADRRMIVVLDDARDAHQVRPLLPGGRCVALITSRNQLRGLAAREGATRVALGAMSEPEAVALLASRLADADGCVDADTDTHLAKLAALCGHLPVAMVIAAERVARGDVGIDGLVAMLKDRPARLDALATGDDATTDVRAVFDWSYRALPPAVAMLYRRLGEVADNGFSLPVAAALAGREPDDVSRLVDQLVARNLLAVAEPQWYVMHDLVREHARDVAVAEDDPATIAAARSRLREWYVHSAYASERASDSAAATLARPGPCPPDVHPQAFPEQRAALAWFERQLRGLATVVAEGAATGDHRLVYRLAAPMAWYYDRVGAFSETAVLVEIALKSARAAGDDVSLAVCLNRRGTSHGRQGRFEEARVDFVEARALFARSGNLVGEYRVVSNLGQVHLSLGELDEAIAMLEAARAETAGFDEAEHLPILSLLSHAYRESGRLDEAAALARMMTKRWEALGHPGGQAAALDHLGAIAVLQGRLDDADVAYRAAGDLYESIGEPYEKAWSLAELGQAEAAAGRVDRARVNLGAALSILDEIGASDSNDLNRSDLEATLAGLAAAPAGTPAS